MLYLDQYRKEAGRQWSLFHALRLKHVFSEKEKQEIALFGGVITTPTKVLTSWEPSEQSPFNRQTIGQIIYAYFNRPRNKPNLAQMVEKRANEIIEQREKASKGSLPEMTDETFKKGAQAENSQSISAGAQPTVEENTAQSAKAGE